MSSKKQEGPVEDSPEPAPVEQNVFVRVAGRPGSSALVFNRPEGGTLVIDREGVEVPEGLVPDLQAAADRGGVTLRLGESE